MFLGDCVNENGLDIVRVGYFSCQSEIFNLFMAFKLEW